MGSTTAVDVAFPGRHGSKISARGVPNLKEKSQPGERGGVTAPDGVVLSRKAGMDQGFSVKEVPAPNKGA